MAENDQPAFDQEALAEAYERALALEKAGDFDAAAKAYEDVLRIDPDDHGGAAVRLASMGRGAVPLKAPDAYVSTLFDQHAEMFDTILVDQLGYDVPLQLREMLLDMNDEFSLNACSIWAAALACQLMRSMTWPDIRPASISRRT